MKWFVPLAMLFFLLLGVGYKHFLDMIPPVPTAIEDVDGVVVFTGGKQRVGTGAQLMAQGFSGPVLVTGVYPGLSVPELFEPLGLDEEQFSQIDLDYEALATADNVMETRAWARKYGLQRILLVTSAYHVPRSLLLFEQLAPRVQVVAYPVPSQEGHVRIFLLEYVKYLAVRLGFISFTAHTDKQDKPQVVTP